MQMKMNVQEGTIARLIREKNNLFTKNANLVTKNANLFTKNANLVD